MARRVVERTATGIAVLAAAVVLSAPSAVAGGPAPKATLSASACSLTATVSWKHLGVETVQWTLTEDGVAGPTASTTGSGPLPSPQSTTFLLAPSTSSHQYSVTAELVTGSVTVGSATTKSLTVACA
jgi:hypothetical protein